MGETLPANRSAAVQPALPELGAVEADHFSGWATEDVDAWLERIMPAFAVAERLTTEYRRGVGLALWQLRRDLGESAYGERKQELARAAGVRKDTVQRWRRDAELHFKLAPVSPRSKSLQESANNRANAVVPSPPPLIDPPPPAPARTPGRPKPAPAKVPPERPQARSERLHTGCPTCRCEMPKPTGVQGKACSHPIIRRNGRYCMDCGQVWR